MNKFKIPHKSHKIYEILGWVGVVFVLGSYSLLATGILNGDSLLYHSLIFLGSAFLGAIAFIKHVYQAVVLNAVFCILATIAFIRIIFF